MPGVQRLADRAAEIGFERVTISLVVVAVGGQRGLHRVGRADVAVQEVVRETALLQHACGEPDEVLGARERGVRRGRREVGMLPGFGHVSDRRTESGLGKGSRPGPTLRGGILESCG